MDDAKSQTAEAKPEPETTTVRRIRVSVWLAMMMMSIFGPGYYALTAPDWTHSMLYLAFAAPLVCFSMAFYFVPID